VNYVLANLDLVGDPLTTVDSRGRIAIFDAVENGHVNIVRLLVEKWGDEILNKVDYVGNTLLHTASATGQKEMLDALVNDYRCSTTALNSLQKEADFYWRRTPSFKMKRVESTKSRKREKNS